ncbi:MAG: DNA adenine methylase [Kiloniellales bacterium]|nr:DNA adenine methylase [Kiloniellales bacterium]
MSAPRRPALRYHGGKWRLAPWIIDHLPAHRIYVEPFGGAASVLLRKPRSYAEIYNDLDDEVVALFEVLRDPERSTLLRERLRLTPFARAEFEAAYRPGDDPVDRARRLLIRSFMGFGSDGHNPAVTTGFRATSNRSGTTPAHDWANLADCLEDTSARLQGVVIERKPAVEVMRQHDGPKTVFYVDPPYLPETRSTKSRKSGGKYHAYRHEMTREDHADLADVLHGLAGMVVISGYDSALYQNLFDGWATSRRQTFADGARAREEVLWLNPAAEAALADGRLL